MSDEAFKELIGHDPDAPNVVITPVVVAPSVRFVERAKRKGKTTIHLMCREHQVPLCEESGYHYLQPSSSDRGGMTWHEMSMEL